MKLVEIRGYHVECSLPEPVRNSISTFASRSSLVVEIIAEDGTSGWGETQVPGVAWAYIEAALAAQVLGQRSHDIGKIWRTMVGARSGGEIAMLAISAIDMALWDLAGRLGGSSISHLLGGKLRDRVPAYASGPFMNADGDPYRDFDREIDSYLKEGFKGVKMRCGYDPRRDAQMVGALRRRLGPDVSLMVDINRGYSLGSAIQASRLLEEAGLLWIEEPIGVDDIDGYRHLSMHTETALAAGEGLAELREFRDFLAARAVAIIQPDLFRCGGVTGALRIAALAEAFETPYVPHVWGTAINFYASLQFAATLPASRIAEGCELPMFEFDRGYNPLIAIAGKPSLNSDGTLTVPDANGIGVEISRDAFAPYVRKSWQVSL